MTVTPNPVDPPLVVTPERLAAAAGIDTLTPSHRDIVIDAILDAQADVEAYLGQPILRVPRTETGRYPWADGWNLAGGGDGSVTVTSVTPETAPTTGALTGYFTVTYLVGLDAAADPTLRPIVRYVTAHALNSPGFVRLWRTVTSAQGVVKSLSAEGQSVSFDTPTLGGGGGKPGSGEPGSLPTLASLDRWRVAGRRVYQAASRYGAWEPS